MKYGTAAQRHDDSLADQRRHRAVQRVHESVRAGRRGVRQEAVRPSACAGTTTAGPAGRAVLHAERRSPIRRATQPTTSPIRTGCRRRSRSSIRTRRICRIRSFPGRSARASTPTTIPYVATLVLNYKHDRFSITPSLQFSSRQSLRRAADDARHRSGVGLRHSAAGSTAGDPRYPYGAAGGGPYQRRPRACAATLSIPDPYTGQFDAIGAFREPAQLLGHLRISYDVSPRVSALAHAGESAANVLRRPDRPALPTSGATTSARTAISSAARARRRSATPTIPAPTFKRSCAIRTSRTSAPTTISRARSTSRSTPTSA